MADRDTLALDPAGPLSGFEQTHIVQDGESVRTFLGDIAALAGGPGSVFGSKWEVAFNWNWSANVTTVSATDLGDYRELVVICRDIVTSVSVTRQLRLSTNNGASYFAGGSDYALIQSSGVHAARSSAAFQNGNSASARTVFMRLMGNIDGAIKLIQHNEGIALFQASNARVDAVQLSLNAAGNITGGQMMVLGLR